MPGAQDDDLEMVDALVVGAGFFGLVAAHHFVEAGLNTVIFEASDQIGGCWRTQAISTTLRRHSLPRGS